MPWLDAHLDLAYMALDGRDLRRACEDPSEACISLPALREANVDYGLQSSGQEILT